MNRLKNQSGMSLIEIMIGVVILLTMMVYVASMASQSNKVAAQNRRKLDTVMVSQSAMEIILANIENNSDMFPAGESSITDIQVEHKYLDQGKWSIMSTVYKSPNVPALLQDTFDVIITVTPLNDPTPFILKHHITVDHNP
ncbi:MAG: type II secretion system protein [Acidobacteriota bacterium]